MHSLSLDSFSSSNWQVVEQQASGVVGARVHVPQAAAQLLQALVENSHRSKLSWAVL
jgi:hypothetical protein